MYIASYIWNELPSTIAESNDLNVFKRNLSNCNA